MQATGSRLGMLLRNLSNVGIGLILAFFFQWKLTLVICAFIPLIALAGMLEMRLITGTSVGDKKGMEQAGKVCPNSSFSFVFRFICTYKV